MNKIIKTVKKEDRSFDSSALRRANANIEVYSPEELAHFGVMGMRWGVRNGRSSGGSGGVKGAIKKTVDFIEKPRRDFDKAAEGMSYIKRDLIARALGYHFGAKYINAQKAKADSPEGKAKAAKKEMKAHREKIVKEFDKRSEAVLSSHEKEFKAKYGKDAFKVPRAERIKRNDEWSKSLTSKMEKMLNDVAAEQLAGSNYKVTAVKGFNDFAPEFIITNGKDSIKHSDILAHADISWKMDVEWGDDGFVKSMKIPEDFLDIKDEEVAFVNMPDEDGDDQDENDDEG